MNIGKANLKLLIRKEMGSELAKRVDTAEAEVHATRGQQRAYKEAVQAVLGMAKIVESERDAGKLSLEESVHVKTYLGKLSAAFEASIDNSGRNGLVAQGRFQALADELARQEASYAAEARLLEQVVAEKSADLGTERPEPGDGLSTDTEFRRPKSLKELRGKTLRPVVAPTEVASVPESDAAPVPQTEVPAVDAAAK
jgi:hypothetical protein